METGKSCVEIVYNGQGIPVNFSRQGQEAQAMLMEDGRSFA